MQLVTAAASSEQRGRRGENTTSDGVKAGAVDAAALRPFEK